MTDLTFARNEFPTMGVELELMLVDLETADLKPSAVRIINDVAMSDLAPHVKLEITESMIEINSSVHRRHDALHTELSNIGRAVFASARKHGVGVCGGGTHPFHRWQERRLSPGERFQAVGHLYGYLAKQFTVFGQHIHIGCRDGDDAVRLIRFLSLFVPHFIAIAASSPFHRGVDTAFDSCRLNAVAAFPLSGRMPAFASWQHFLEFFERLVRLGIASTVKDFYWDIRPKPEFGTLEIRVSDTPLDVQMAADLAAYAQVLATWGRTQQAADWLDDYVYRYNRFQAARFGYDGRVVISEIGERCSVAEHILHTTEQCRDVARALRCEEALQRVADLSSSRCNGAEWLRQAHEKYGSFVPLMEASAGRWRDSLGLHDA